MHLLTLAAITAMHLLTLAAITAKVKTISVAWLVALLHVLI